jgi:predicted small lipoprotein YifL
MKNILQFAAAVLMLGTLAACYTPPVQKEPLLTDRKVQDIRASSSGSMNSLDREAAANRVRD